MPEYIKPTVQYTYYGDIPTHPQGRTLILTTSMKHIRELGNIYQSYQPILQGTSGGKAKMQHYFTSSYTDVLMIGLIDTWRDEMDLFMYVDTLVIAKVPFDPPTDPYFLAKTQGMTHNFEQYSKPIVLSKLNTLIGSYISINPQGVIICADPRIHTSEWGKFLKAYML